MGTLHYGTSTKALRMNDRMLAHLKLVIVTKLRREESFTISWTRPVAEGAGRCTLWMHPAIPLLFEFDDAELVEADPELLKELTEGAYAAHGIMLPADCFIEDAARPTRPAS